MGVLEGVTVVELSIAIAAPSCCRALAFHGAEVLRVESRTNPDVARLFGSAWAAGLAPGPYMDTSPYLGEMSANKRSVGLELKQPAAREALLALVAGADVFVTNYSTPAVRALGLAAEDLIRKVLMLADDFDLAIEQRPDSIAADPWFVGVAAIDRKLRSLLESEGVTTIAADPGMRFDPREHDAIANVPGSGRAEGEIVEQIRRGYRLRDRVIRPALVAVAAGDPATASTTDTRPN